MNYTKIQKWAGILLAGAGLVSSSVSRGAEFWLRTGMLTNTMPDGQSVVFWAFAQDGPHWTSPGALSIPGPQLKVAAGETLILHVTNTLPEPVSVEIPGQYGSTLAGMVIPHDPSSPYAGRVRSMTLEAAPNGAQDYTWNDVQTGTFLYHSASHPSIQVQMGLYGALTVAAPGPTVYSSTYNSEVTLFLSEVDPNLHAAVAGSNFGAGPAFAQSEFCDPAGLIQAIYSVPKRNNAAEWVTEQITGIPESLADDLNQAILLYSIFDPTIFPESILSPATLAMMQPSVKLNQDYTPTARPFVGDLVRMNRMILYDGMKSAGITFPAPKLMSSAGKAKAQYFMVNGQAYTNGQPTNVVGAAGSPVLVRLLNACMDLRTMTLNNGGDMALIGEDGQAAPFARLSSVILLPALKTVDALWTPPAQGAYAIYDRHLGLESGNALPGGMFTFLGAGAPITSAGGAAPSIIIPPASQTTPEFGNATFTVVASGAGLTYQWYATSDSTTVVGSGPSLTLANVNRTSSGAQYQVVVSGSGGSPVTSAAATLNVVPAGPTIVTQPTTPGIVTMGSAASFTVVAGGSNPFAYQWFAGPSAAGPWTALMNDGANISGADSATLQFAAIDATNGGWYEAVVTGPVVGLTPTAYVPGPGASVTSAAAYLGIAPQIITQPTPQMVNDTATATFSVAAAGTGLTYQWYRKNPGGSSYSPIPGATGSSYSFQAFYLNDNGAYYQVVVTGDAGPSMTSTEVSLTVNTANVAPFITEQPASVSANGGAGSSPVSFAVAAYGDPAPTYQWQRYNGSSWVPLVDSTPSSPTPYMGVATATLTVGSVASGIDLAEAGTYQVIVSNTHGSATSANAHLIITQTFAGTPVADIPFDATATQYPALTDPVPQLTGSFIENVTVALNLTSVEPFDISALLLSPDSTSVASEFMSGLGPLPMEITNTNQPELGLSYSYGVTNCMLTFDDAALTPVSTNYWLVSGNYKPTVNFLGAPITPLPAPAPQFPPGPAYATDFSVFMDTVPAAGSWSLYLNDVTAVGLNPPIGPDSTINDWNLTLTAGPYIVPTPTITSQPAGTNVYVGQSASFSVVAIGPGTLSYQWYNSGTPVGGSSSTYSIPSAQLTDVGDYFVVVTSTVGIYSSSVTSSPPATLTVLPVPPLVDIALSPAANASGWNTTSVGVTITATMQANGAPIASIDYGAGGANAIASTHKAVSSASFTVSQEGVTTITATATDTAGQTGTATATVMLDETPPVVTATTTSAAPPDSSGFYGNPVTVTITATDMAGSGVASITYSAVPGNVGGQTITPTTVLASSAVLNFNLDGITILTYSATDVAGNTSSQQLTVKLNQGLPTVTWGTPTGPTLNGSGWYTGPVSYPYTAYSMSGIQSYNPASPVAITAQGAAVTATTTVTDTLNHTTTSTSPPVRIDSTPPTITFGPYTLVPTAGRVVGSQTWYQSATVLYTIADQPGLSGVASSSLPLPPVLQTYAQGVGSSIAGSATDVAGNTATYTSIPYNVDSTAPTFVNVAPVPAANAAGWDNANVTGWTISARDLLSGVATVQYRVASLMGAGGRSYTNTTKVLTTLSAGNVANYTSPTISFTGGQGGTLFAEGAYLLIVEYVLTDAAGNTTPRTQVTLPIKIDKTAPVTTTPASVTVTPSGLPNAAGWFRAASAQVVLTGSDAGSGIASVTYSATGAQPIQSMTVAGTSTTVNITAQGVTTISYFVTDYAGNVGATRTQVVRLDDIIPITNPATLSPAPNGAGWNRANVLVNMTGTDAGGSGVASVTYSATGAQLVASTTVPGASANLYITANGVTTISYFVTDVAGNVGPTLTQVVSLDKTVPLTAAPTIVPAPNSAGWINSTPVTVTMMGTDNYDTLASVTYSATGVSPIATTTTAGPTATLNGFTTQGATTVSFYLTDIAGNNSTTRNFAVNVDTVAPVVALGTITGGYTGSGKTRTLTSVRVPVTVTEQTSGVASTAIIVQDNSNTIVGTATFTTGTTSGTQYNRLVTLTTAGPAGTATYPYTITVTTTDRAGNVTTVTANQSL